MALCPNSYFHILGLHWFLKCFCSYLLRLKSQILQAFTFLEVYSAQTAAALIRFSLFCRAPLAQSFGEFYRMPCWPCARNKKNRTQATDRCSCASTQYSYWALQIFARSSGDPTPKFWFKLMRSFRTRHTRSMICVPPLVLMKRPAQGSLPFRLDEDESDDEWGCFSSLAGGLSSIASSYIFFHKCR